jgi:hypothetical protein
LSTEGANQTATGSVTDGAGNIASTLMSGISLDLTAPTIQCGIPDGLWHASDVSIACTSNDVLSGLANGADASFALTTDVEDGTEDANAATGGRVVLDLADNASVVGPIAGNHIDMKAPRIIITAPANSTYLLGQTAAASYLCTDGGSGVASCTGPVANGNPIDTTALGAKTFTVKAVDNVGNTSSVSVTYQVVPAFPLTGRLDSFNRVNGGVGSNWDGQTSMSYYQILANQLDAQSNGLIVWKGVYGTSQEAYITLSAIDQQSSSQGVLLKVQNSALPSAGMISVAYDAVGKGVRVATLRAGSSIWTQYPTRAVTFVDGDQLGARVLATGDIQIFKNGLLVGKVTLNSTDKTFFNSKGGKIGLSTTAAPHAIFDDFGGGTLS